MTRRASLDGCDLLRFVLAYAHLRHTPLSDAEIIQRFMDGDDDKGALEEPDGPREAPLA